jgi:SAM-dependent methyltransferase
MHKSANITAKLFFEKYWDSSFSKILEIGSFEVNGALRDHQPKDSQWMGVDLEAGPGVDLVVANSGSLPFPDKSFDVIVASSVFEHDPFFWNTFNEMVRLVSDEGFIYINAPSNGTFHRYPLDAFRFYPDAGKALRDWGRTIRPSLRLMESFITPQNEDVWNDFCAIFGVSSKDPKQFISIDIECFNIWRKDEFISNSFLELTEDQTQIELQKNKQNQLNSELNNLSLELFNLKTSITWRFTQPLRNIYSFIRGTILRIRTH